MRPCHNPYGGVNPLIDKMIGNAYDIVKYVASYLKEIRYVAENMQTVHTAVHGTQIELNVTGDGVETTLVATFPDGINWDGIRNVAVMAYATTGSMYFPGPDTFNYGVALNGDVTISINSGMEDLLEAEYRITVTVLPTE